MESLAENLVYNDGSTKEVVHGPCVGVTSHLK